METKDLRQYRILISKILRASTKIAIDHKRGAANFVRVPSDLRSTFPGEIAGISVHEDIGLTGKIIVGRIDADFIAEETINL